MRPDPVTGRAIVDARRLGEQELHRELSQDPETREALLNQIGLLGGRSQAPWISSRTRSPGSPPTIGFRPFERDEQIESLNRQLDEQIFRFNQLGMPRLLELEGESGQKPPGRSTQWHLP